MPIEEYLRLMMEQELQKIANVEQCVRGIKTQTIAGNSKSNEWEQSEN